MFLPSTLLTFLSSLIFSITPDPVQPSFEDNAGLRFELRQYHAVTHDARVLVHDHPSPSSLQPSLPAIRTRRTPISRPLQPFTPTSTYLGYDSGWEEDEVDAPDVENRETLLALAKMTNNAYLLPNETGWYDLEGKWNVSYPFGWEPSSDGFRGHVFATPDNSTVVLSIKGTSAAFVGGGGPTAKKDKFNDNLLFSCCCARVDWTWTTVCGCYRQGWQCDQGCLEEALVKESLFYPVGTNLYNNITYMYPESDIWIIGHSLGGALASLLGVTFGLPVVTFESPGERLAAGRLHLPSPPSTHHITHVYHTADPIAMGTCNGVLSSCALGGYAMESRCHLGKSIVYDTVTNLSWAVDIRTHGIVNVIERVLSQPWEEAEQAGRQVPKAKSEEDCVECYSWEFGDFPPPAKGVPGFTRWNESRLEP